MPLFQQSEHTHHHSPLAGVGAGAMAVLVVFGVILIAWHRVGGPIGQAVIVIVWTLAAAGIAGALGALVYGVLWLLHRIRHPEVLSRHTVHATAEIQSDSAPPAALPQSRTAGELPAGGSHTHYHFDSAEAVQAALLAMQERQAHGEGMELDS